MVVASYCEETHVLAVSGSAEIGDAAATPAMDCATWVMVDPDVAIVGFAGATNTVTCLPARRDTASARGADAPAAMITAA